jgi:MerR family transcriptional regulator, heat shock protein HspR
MKNDKDRPLYMISVAADLAGVHPQTLRTYEMKGLVTPKRSAGNTRLYSQSDIERLDLISRLTDEGINLAGVIRILDMEDRLNKIKAENDSLRKKNTELEDKLHEYEVRQTISALVKTNGSGPLTVRILGE